MRIHLRGSDLLMLESNHDLEMLKVGPYPWAIKQRVMGRMGHLSNEVASDFIREELGHAHLDADPGSFERAQQSSGALAEQAAMQALERPQPLFTRLVIADPARNLRT